MIYKDSKMINTDTEELDTQFAIKTLGITVLGAIAMNINGVSTQTNLEDPFLPEWAVADIEGVVATLEVMDALAVHFEISPIQTIGHVTIPNGMIDWLEDFPDVFDNLEQLYEDYAAALLELIENPPQEITEMKINNARDRLNDFGHNIPENRLNDIGYTEPTKLED
jgi:hypothetical protein